MARARRGGAVLLLAGLVVLLVLAVVADRAAQQVAESRAATQLQAQLGTAEEPEVDIQGFPFLTQARQQSLSSVRVVADGVRPPGSTTTVQHVDLKLRDVSSRDNFATSTAEQVSGTATLDYPTVKTLTGQSLRYARDDKVEVSAPTTVMGVPVTAVVVGRPVVDEAEQTLSLTEPQLSVDGVSVPDSAAGALLDSAVKPAPVTGVPFGLKLNSVSAQPQGLVAGLTGTDVAFRP
ncbi:MAG TPA: DUF2993 domain-containing protein [Propionibacteriaceae bacterium]|nr:DUF2993 domain-containing protein [Propionibacteriaceae bacterium]